jgi:hypothetical protein
MEDLEKEVLDIKQRFLDETSPEQVNIPGLIKRTLMVGAPCVFFLLRRLLRWLLDGCVALFKCPCCTSPASTAVGCS